MPLPGPGDPATWPAFDGHPNDPRHPGDDEPPMPDCDLCPREADWCVEAEPAACKADAWLCAGCAPRYVGGLLEVTNGPDSLEIRRVDEDDALPPPEPDYEAMENDR